MSMLHSPFIAVDEESDAPFYRQIYESIRRAILIGEILPGRRLPASRFLAEQLGVSRTTVVNTYDQLLAEGYLESKRGSGTFVAERLPEQFFTAPDSKRQDNKTETPKRHLKLSRFGKRVFEESPTIARNSPKTRAVPFQHGLAAVDEFPFNVWTKLTGKIYRTLPRDDFGYGEPGGFYPLRLSIAAHLKSTRAVNCSPEQVIITTGAQHAFDLIGRVLLDRGVEVLVEDPCFAGAKQAFQSFGAKLVPVPVDKDGFNLSSALKKNLKARLACVTPSHQFPLGVTMSLSRRLKLLEWAERAGAWIVEDDYDSEFRYVGRPLASLQGLDRNGRVLYIGTFSKTIFPALRLGCLVVPRDLIELFAAVRALNGSHSPLIAQATLAEFIHEGHFASHVRRMRRLYEERQEILISEARKNLAGSLDIEKSVSGMHVIGWLNEGVKDTVVAQKAAALGVKTSAVSSYSLTTWQRRGGLVLGYTAIGEKQIKIGIKELARAIDNSVEI